MAWIRSSRTSHAWRRGTFFDQGCLAILTLISSSNGLMKGLPFIVCVLTMWSSRIVWMSSTEDKIVKPVSLYLLVLNSTGSQSSCIFRKAFSSENSYRSADAATRIAAFDALTFDAPALTCSNCSMNGSKPSCNTFFSVVPVSGLRFRWKILDILSQWRSRIPGLHKILITGRCSWKNEDQTNAFDALFVNSWLEAKRLRKQTHTPESQRQFWLHLQAIQTEDLHSFPFAAGALLVQQIGLDLRRHINTHRGTDENKQVHS